MLNANEAYVIAKRANRCEIELKEIECEIKNRAINGGYSVTLYPSSPYHPKTIKKLEQSGYKVDSCLDTINDYYNYCIEWGNEWSNEEE